MSRCWTNLNSFLLTLLTSRGKHPLFRVYNFFLTRPKVKFWVNFHVPKLAILLEVSKATSGGLFQKQNEWLNCRLNLKLLARRSFLWYFQYFYCFSYVPLMMISILASSDFLPPPSPFVAKSRFDDRFFYLWNCNFGRTLFSLIFLMVIPIFICPLIRIFADDFNILQRPLQQLLQKYFEVSKS